MIKVELTDEKIKLLDKILSVGIDNTIEYLEHEEGMTKEKLDKEVKELEQIREIAKELSLSETLSYLDNFRKNIWPDIEIQ